MAGSLATNALEPRTCLAPLKPVARLGQRFPKGSCDCHCHVFAPINRYPLFPHRNYTPAIVTIDDYLEVMQTFGIDRAVLVQPSVYGFDNSVLLDALTRLPDQCRGVAVVAPTIQDEEISSLHEAGVRGLRINRRNPGGLELSVVKDLTHRIARFGWHLQLLISVEDTPDVERVVEESEVPVVIDHFGFVRPERGPEAQGFRAIVSLAERGRVWIKISAPYRLCGGPRHSSLMDPIVERLVERAPHRLLWASDWPHTECYDEVPDDADLVELIWRWLPTEALRRQVLIDNPNQLYWSV